MNSNLDVWAIQARKEELINALDKIKTDKDIILFTNLLSNFKLGHQTITCEQFDTVLYSEENDILIMLMRDGAANATDIRKYLDKKGFMYHEVNFAPSSIQREDDNTIPEIWFAREQSVVEDAFKDTLSKDVKKEFEYYPFLTGGLTLGYTTNVEREDLSYLGQERQEEFPVDGRIFRGLVKLEDKLILLINQGEKRNVTATTIGEVAKKYNFTYTVLENKDFSITSIEKKKLTKEN